MLFQIMTGVVTAIATVLACLACKIEPYNKNEDGSSNINIKGILTFVLCGFDIKSSNPWDYSELIIAGLAVAVGFTMFFYIFYGIMSLLKVSGDDVQDRRSKAFWVNAVLSLLAIFAV